MQYSDCRKPVVFVIDMLNGFIKEGALHDERIADIIPSIQKLLDALACRNVLSVIIIPLIRVSLKRFRSIV